MEHHRYHGAHRLGPEPDSAHDEDLDALEETFEVSEEHVLDFAELPRWYAG